MWSHRREIPPFHWSSHPLFLPISVRSEVVLDLSRTLLRISSGFHPLYLSARGYFLPVSFNRAPPVSCQLGRSLPNIFQLRSQVPVRHCQAKLRILHQKSGDPRTRRDSAKFVLTLRVGGWAQEVSASTKAPFPRRVQAKERSLLWVPSVVIKTVDWKKKKKKGKT